MSTLMQVAAYRELGDAQDVLQVREIEAPAPGRGEVLVRVCLSGVNPSDWRARRAGRPWAGAEWSIPHSDGAGVIEAVGPGVAASRIGERVWMWNAAWNRSHGTASQYVCLPARHAVLVPDHVSNEFAAGIGIPYMTAWYCLHVDGPITGKTVLVTGGAGAVGNAAIQLAKYLGAIVITTVSSPEKEDIARAAGADFVIDYRASESVVDEIAAATPDGVDIIIEVALGANIDCTARALNPRGTVVAYAPEPDLPRIPTQRLLFLQASLRFVLVYTISEAEQDAAVAGIMDALSDCTFTQLPTRVFGLSDIVAAHDAVEAGAVGKVLVDPWA
ncbi:NADPH2:quinone reductase [Rhodococcus sp. 27YEA15]|uniref:NADPH:quinone reductase n=1 Tax=Rhodococcus sp. 27YEA15 TaxID=3156259 RepID=UPI003C7C5786